MKISTPPRLPAAPSSHPSEILLQWLEDNDVSQKEFAAALKLSPPLVSMMLKKKRKISRAVLPLIAKVTDTNESDWVAQLELHDDWNKRADRAGRPSGLPSHFLPGVLSNEEIHTALRLGLIEITDLKSDSVKEASVDLTLGRIFRHPLPKWAEENATDGNNRQNDKNDEATELILRPGESWTVWTREHVRLDPQLCGRIAGISDFIVHGIQVGFGLQINPGWEGQPFATLCNPTGEDYPLEFEQPFASLEVHALSSPAVLSRNREE